MNESVEACQVAEIGALLRASGEIAVAISGGVDSMTLAHLAHGAIGCRSRMFHAVSAAVPTEATTRVEAAACALGWNLTVMDAGEFTCTEYVRNPVNRCFHCKDSLYSSIKRRTGAQIVSGTNVDDLGEYRPGLAAAAEHGVRHPFVELGLTKSAVRGVARHIGLLEIAELPASPCLSSRIETGIAIQPRLLAFVHAVERAIARSVTARTIRCRIREEAIVIELDDEAFSSLTADQTALLADDVCTMATQAGLFSRVRFAQYRSGSAFLVNRYGRA
jgi:uncharacterized protein